jgi:hypothetical protein
MNQKLKATALIAAAIMLLVAMPAVAQQSAANKASATVISTDIDNYMDVNYYDSVKLNKMFAFAGIDSTSLDLGYAQKVGNLYVGTYYSGNILYMTTPSTISTTVKTTPTIDGNGIITNTETVTTKKIDADTGFHTVNNINALFGIGGMGLKLGFYENMTSYLAPTAAAILSEETTNSGTQVNTKKEYTDTSRASGFMTPSVAWGMNLPFGTGTLSPNAKVTVDFYQDSAAYTYNESKTIAGSTIYDGVYNTNLKTYTLNNYGRIAPTANVGANLAFEKKDGEQATVGLNYEIYIPIYTEGGKKETTDQTLTKYSTTAKTTQNTTTVNTDAYSYMRNTITPAFYYSKDMGDKLTVGFNAKVIASLTNGKSTPLTVTTTKTTVDNYDQSTDADSVTTIVETQPDTNGTTDTTNLYVSPYLNAGFAYKIVPEKLSLNAGLAINAPRLTQNWTTYTRTTSYSKTTKTTDGNGVVTQDEVTYTGSTNTTDLNSARSEKTSSSTTWSALGASLSFGFTFNFNENFALDTNTTLGSDTISVLGSSDGLLYKSLNLVFSLKL